MIKECVILLHGLGRTSFSMLYLQKKLENSGYFVWNESYPSTKNTIEELAADVINQGLASCHEKGATAIHFVTHSLGGILVRYYFQNHELPNVGRVVMLAPPNHGSEVTDRYRKKWWYQLATGPVGQQLGTEATSVPNTLQPIELEIGVIIGKKTSDPWFSSLFAEENDGKVSVSSAKLAEMQDSVLVDIGHSYLTFSKKVVEQTLAFLKSGKFEKLGEMQEKID